MAQRVCPWWIGYILLNPLRRFLEDPQKMLGPYVEQGMTVIEPGCGMGYFTLPLARMVGQDGRVVAVDMQEKMLSGLRRRADKAGVSSIVQTRCVDGTSLGLEDMAGAADMAVAIHMVHEVPDPEAFFSEIAAALKPGGRMVFIEPKGHVSPDAFAKSLDQAMGMGFSVADQQGTRALLIKDAG